MKEWTKDKMKMEKKDKRTKSTSRTRLSIFPYHRKDLRTSLDQIIVFLMTLNFMEQIEKIEIRDGGEKNEESSTLIMYTFLQILCHIQIHIC
jgi:hypothetical protein